MNLSLPGVVMFVVGVVLIYAAVKNRDPRDVVLNALGQKAKFGALPATETSKTVPKETFTSSPATPIVPPGTTWTTV